MVMLTIEPTSAVDHLGQLFLKAAEFDRSVFELLALSFLTDVSPDVISSLRWSQIDLARRTLKLGRRRPKGWPKHLKAPISQVRLGVVEMRILQDRADKWAEILHGPFTTLNGGELTRELMHHAKVPFNDFRQLHHAFVRTQEMSRLPRREFLGWIFDRLKAMPDLERRVFDAIDWSVW
jgi:hypothetical protein